MKTGLVNKRYEQALDYRKLSLCGYIVEICQKPQQEYRKVAEETAGSMYVIRQVRSVWPYTRHQFFTSIQLRERYW